MEIKSKKPVSPSGIISTYKALVNEGRLTSKTMVVQRRVIMAILLRAVPGEIEVVLRWKGSQESC